MKARLTTFFLCTLVMIQKLFFFFFLNFMFVLIHKYDFKLFVIFGVKNLYCWWRLISDQIVLHFCVQKQSHLFTLHFFFTKHQSSFVVSDYSAYSAITIMPYDITHALQNKVPIFTATTHRHHKTKRQTDISCTRKGNKFCSSIPNLIITHNTISTTLLLSVYLYVLSKRMQFTILRPSPPLNFVFIQHNEFLVYVNVYRDHLWWHL